MDFARFSRLYPEAAGELRDYACRFRFSKSLLDLSATTLARSIELGDGALWSDSLLIAGLVDPESSLRTLFDRFPGYRTSQLAKADFTDTLSTQTLVIRPEFQTSLTDALYRHKRYHHGAVDEETLLDLDLQAGMEHYADQYADMSLFATDLSRPLFQQGLALGERGGPLLRMSYMLEDCFLLSMMCRQHPFDAFARTPVRNLHDQPEIVFSRCSYSDIARQYADKSAFHHKRRNYYWQLRDAAHVPFLLLSDDILRELALAFDRNAFAELCTYVDEEEAREDLQDEDAVQGCRDRFHYASALIYASDLPISFVIERLQTWRKHGHSNAWPLSAKLVLSAGELGIQACMFDVGTATRFDHGVPKQRKLLADVGVWTPNPIWTSSVLERLAAVLSKPNESEKTFQYLFEAYPEFILDELHVESYPQVMLFQETGKNLRPDFAIRRHESNFVDLVELKRASANVVVIEDGRPRLSAAVVKAIAQLQEYRDWFRQPCNRDWFRRRYGLDGFEPRLTLVIGRTLPSVNEEMTAKAMSGAQAEIVTYDQILKSALRRRKWMP